jgi:hypothetical protein
VPAIGYTVEEPSPLSRAVPPFPAGSSVGDGVSSTDVAVARRVRTVVGSDDESPLRQPPSTDATPLPTANDSRRREIVSSLL